ncbi:MAG TPA: glycosyltransferase family 4 protein [Solirubrobacterales bacterium]|nr:glycosyltransferase family 4 protein [Solirubrobacterales bacterium]
MGIAARTAFRLRSGLRRLPAGSQEPQYDPVTYPLTWARGWMLVERGFSRVRVEVSGTGVSYARLHAVRRPDLARLSRYASAPMCGWEAAIDVPDMEPGTPVTVTAAAEGRAGELRLGSVDATVGERVRRPPADPAWLRTLAGRTRIAATDSRPRDGRLRLLVFTHQLDLGGGQLYLHELLRLLMRGGGVECMVVCPTDGPLRKELEQWGVGVHLGEPVPADGARYEARLAELGSLARTFGADVILANTVLTFDGIDLAARVGVPAIWAIHDSIPVERCEGGLFFGLDDHVVERFRAAVESPATLVFEADATRDLYSGYADAARLRRIDYGIPLAEIDRYRRDADREALRTKHGIALGDRMVVCVGTLQPRKAQTSLALAFAQAGSEAPEATLVFVGDERSVYSDGLRELVSRLGPVGDRIRIEPMTPDVMQWLEMADGFAIASDVESMPRSILEAMGFGLPVLATSAWGIPELIEDGVNGLLCEPNSFDSLVDAMRRLLCMSEEDSDAIGDAAQRTIRETRDSSLYEREYRALLGELTAGAGRRHAAALAEGPAGILQPG